MTTEVLPERDTRARLLPGSAAVGLLLALGRGGSYIGISNRLFLTDALVAAAVARWILRPGPRRRVPSSTRGIVLVLLTWSLLHMVPSAARSVVGLRDAAPYAYLILALVAFDGIRSATVLEIERTARFLEICLCVHLVWSLVGLLSPSALLRTPLLAASTEVHLLTERSDFDSACNAILAGLGLQRTLSGNTKVLQKITLLAAIGAVVFAHARSGLIALFVLFALILVRFFSRRSLHGNRKLATAAVLLLVLPLGAASLPFTLAGKRLLSSVGVASSSGVSLSTAENAQGTSTARSNAWRTSLHYSTSSLSRSAIGVGFGPNFLLESGALFELVGQTDDVSTRAPHDYYLDVLARLGLVGLILVVALHVVGWRKALNLLRAERRGDMAILVVGIVVAIPTVAALGVVLEGPFGAVPFAWALGAVDALDHPEGVQ